MEKLIKKNFNKKSLMPFFDTLNGKVKNSWIDNNLHMNISRYSEIIDKANDSLNLLIFKNKINKFLVSSKFLVENKKELLKNEYWEIKSSVIKIDEYYFTAIHIIYNDRIVVAKAYIKVVGINKRRKILKFNNFEKKLLYSCYTEGIKSGF